MRALITGACGFAGRHLWHHLLGEGDEVTGLTQERPADLPSGWEPIAADVRDADRVAAVVDEARPTAIYHLAALSHVGASWSLKRETLETNFLGAFSVLEGALKPSPRPRVLLVGSAEQYGRVGKEGPIAEDTPLRPVTPYGVAKAAQELLGQQYARTGEVEVVLVRAFNHAGPGQAPTFVISEWARAVAEMEAGRREPVLEVGNIDVARDFTDVRDIVPLYRLLATRGRSGEVYNACSGAGRELTEVLDHLRKLSRVPFEVRRRAAVRPVDVRSFVGDNARVRAELGWEPRIPFEETIRAVLDDWRWRLGAGTP